MNAAARSLFVLVTSVSSCDSGATTAPQPSPTSPADAVAATPAKPDCRDEPRMAYLPGGRMSWHKLTAPHVFDIEPLWLDRYEVTVAEYRECVTAGACTVPHTNSEGFTDADRNPLVCTWEIADPSLPINCLDGDHHDAYCAWRGKRTPFAHELQWAAQGREERRPHPWGDAPATCELAIVDQNTDDGDRGCGRGRPWPPGSRPKDVSRDGIFDLAGNVGEQALAPFRDDRRLGDLRDVCGATWQTRYWDKKYLCTPGARETFSDDSGIRCAKTPTTIAPCTVVGPTPGITLPPPPSAFVVLRFELEGLDEVDVQRRRVEDGFDPGPDDRSLLRTYRDGRSTWLSAGTHEIIWGALHGGKFTWSNTATITLEPRFEWILVLSRTGHELRRGPELPPNEG